MARPHGHIDKDIDKEFYKDIEQWAAIGMTNEQIATLLSMHKNTFLKRLEANEELKKILERGRVRAIGKVASAAFQMAVSQKHPSMTSFFLRCKGGGSWLEKSTVALTDPNGAPLGTALVKVNLNIPDNSKSKRGK